MEQLAGEGIRLIITVDNGSSAVEEIALARGLGMEVVVTDHHQVPAVPPPAIALVNPWLKGSQYPFPGLSGAGVAFKLVWALSQRFSRSKKVSPEFRDFLVEALSLTALGTISDVVPLEGENRILAKHGLLSLEKSNHPGLRCLVAYGLRGNRGPLTASHVAFRIAPTLNAAGRLGDADLALRVLLTSSPDQARDLVAALEGENRRRQRIEEDILRTARDRVRREINLATDRAIVLADGGWHVGVLGIVASRLAEEFCRPTILISIDGDRGRGSARSIQGVDICSALKDCAEHLLGFGGHEGAAGVEISPRRIDSFRQALNEAIPLPPGDMVPQVEIELEVELRELSMGLIRELQSLEPHGYGNRSPVFLCRGLELAGEPRVMGQTGQHLSFLVRSGKGSRSSSRDNSQDRARRSISRSLSGISPVLKAIAFGWGKEANGIAASDTPVDLAFGLIRNSWGGEERLELQVKEMRRARTTVPG